MLDLDGARLRFDGMDFSAAGSESAAATAGAGGGGTVRLRLRLDVVRFPNPLTTSF